MSIFKFMTHVEGCRELVAVQVLLSNNGQPTSGKLQWKAINRFDTCPLFQSIFHQSSQFSSQSHSSLY